MEIVDTLFLVLTGTHVPKSAAESEDPLTIPDDLSSRPKEQVSEIISIITELLPTLPKGMPMIDGMLIVHCDAGMHLSSCFMFLDRLFLEDPLFDTEYRHAALQQKEQDKGKQEPQSEDVEMTAATTESPSDKRRELLESHPERVQKLSRILIPTLIQVYATTGHLKIRQRVIQAIVKLVYFTGESNLKIVLKVSREKGLCSQKGLSVPCTLC